MTDIYRSEYEMRSIRKIMNHLEKRHRPCSGCKSDNIHITIDGILGGTPFEMTVWCDDCGWERVVDEDGVVINT